MHFSSPLLFGTLIKRYKRFFADVKLEDEKTITAHCPNTGPMLGVLAMPQPAWISPHNDPKRKLQYTLEILEKDGVLVGCNTHRTNHIAKELFQNETLSPFGKTSIHAEVKISDHSRIDFILNEESDPIYVEVKNVSLTNGEEALFPDTISERAQKHITELMHLRAQGRRTALVYIIQRNDVTGFRPGGGLDLRYNALCEEAASMGVEFYAYSCHVSSTEITADKKLTIIL